MDSTTKILIVEDDMIIAANISLQLTKLGYEVTGIESRGEEAIVHTQVNPPDIILMDINLKGRLNGIDAVKEIQKRNNIPVIYLTANTDEATFEKAKGTHPYAFIPKPFNQLILERTIALVVEQLSDSKGNESKEKSSLEVMEDRIFVRHNGKMIKLLLDNILFIEADRNYCNIVSSNGDYLVVCTLKTIEKELKNINFLRVHRSFMVNLRKLDVVSDNYMEIGRKVIPLSKSFKGILWSRLHTI